MEESSPQVARIQASSKPFDDAVAGRTDLDVAASAERFEALCHEALRERYPGAIVEFTRSPETAVELEGGSEDGVAAGEVEQICADVLARGEWTVYRDESGGVGG
jgi:hypothetical protein